jgi:hypothetical protein
MIDLKDSDRLVPGIMIVVATILFCVALLYWFLVPPPTTAGLAQSHTRTRDQIFTSIDTSNLQGKAAVAAVSPHLGDADAETVTAFVLAVLTSQAQRQSLQMTAFRPERTQPLAGVTELRYTVQITGKYPQVHAALSALDSNPRIVVRSIQIESGEQSSGAVTALLGLSAYMPVDPLLTVSLSPGAPASRQSRTASRTGTLRTGGEHG